MADHSNLPAPYESPWRQLRGALVAVLASLGLELRVQWRRHRIRVLAAGLGLMLIVGLGVRSLLARAPLADRPATVSPAAPLQQEPPITEPPPPRPSEPPPGAVPRVPMPAAAEPAVDPMRSAMAGDDSPALIDATEAVAETGLLRLRLSAAYQTLDPRRQRRQAETWLERSLELGFEQLELISADGQSVGRRARVGSGMILLDPNAEG